MATYRKTQTVQAEQVFEPFTIDSMEGRLQGKAGDYRVGPGPKGEYWIVDREIFEATYEPVDEY